MVYLLHASDEELFCLHPETKLVLISLAILYLTVTVTVQQYISSSSMNFMNEYHYCAWSIIAYFTYCTLVRFQSDISLKVMSNNRVAHAWTWILISFECLWFTHEDVLEIVSVWFVRNGITPIGVNDAAFYIYVGFSSVRKQSGLLLQFWCVKHPFLALFASLISCIDFRIKDVW